MYLIDCLEQNISGVFFENKTAAPRRAARRCASMSLQPSQNQYASFRNSVVEFGQEVEAVLTSQINVQQDEVRIGVLTPR
jgi:hypothetical protein